MLHTSSRRRRGAVAGEDAKGSDVEARPVPQHRHLHSDSVKVPTESEERGTEHGELLPEKNLAPKKTRTETSVNQPQASKGGVSALHAPDQALVLRLSRLYRVAEMGRAWTSFWVVVVVGVSLYALL